MINIDLIRLKRSINFSGDFTAANVAATNVTLEIGEPLLVTYNDGAFLAIGNGQLGHTIISDEFRIAALLDLKVDKSSIDQPYGVAGLNANAKIETTQIQDLWTNKITSDVDIFVSNTEHTFPAGTDLTTILKGIALTLAHPITTQPSIMTINPNMEEGDYEVGTYLTGTIQTTLDTGLYENNGWELPTQPHTGVVVEDYSLSVYDNGVEYPLISNLPNAEYVIPSNAIRLDEGLNNVLFHAVINHSAGNIPVNNDGTPYNAGQILHGQKVDTISYNGYRKFFIGHSNDTYSTIPVLNAGLIRGLSVSKLVKEIEIPVDYIAPTGAKQVVVAAPSHIMEGNGLFVIADQMGNPITPVFEKQTTIVNVGGEGLYNPMPYDIWIYKINSGLTANTKYTIKIK